MRSPIGWQFLSSSLQTVLLLFLLPRTSKLPHLLRFHSQLRLLRRLPHPHLCQLQRLHSRHQLPHLHLHLHPLQLLRSQLLRLHRFRLPRLHQRRSLRQKKLTSPTLFSSDSGKKLARSAPPRMLLMQRYWSAQRLSPMMALSW